MRSLPSILAAVALMAVFLLYACTYQVRFNEVAIIKTFGDADPEKDVRTEPGLGMRWPFPIQTVVKYDTRIRVLEDTIEEAPTKDSKNLVVTTFTGWRIADPYKFLVRYEKVERAEDALRAKIRADKKQVVGKHVFSEFISTDPAERKLRDIEQEMQLAFAEEALDQFGIETVIFGIKRLGLPEAVTKDIFENMKKLEENKAENYKTEGEAKAAEIEAEAIAARQRIMAVAEGKADQIRNEGLRRVGEIYDAFAEHQELRIFLDKLEAVEQLLETRSTVVLDTKIAPVDLFELDRPKKPQADADAEEKADPVETARESLEES